MLDELRKQMPTTPATGHQTPNNQAAHYTQIIHRLERVGLRHGLQIDELLTRLEHVEPPRLQYPYVDDEGNTTQHIP